MKAGDSERVVGPSGSGIPDVSSLPIEGVIRRPDSALDLAVRRALEELKSPQDIIFGWNSFIG